MADDHPLFRLGCLPADPNKKRLELARYVDPAVLPALPASRMWFKAFEYGMHENDTLGTCGPGYCANQVEVWTSWSHPTTVMPSDGAVQAMYSAVGGYVPGDPSTDRGTSVDGCIAYMESTGLGGIKVLTAVTINPRNLPHTQYGIEVLGGVGMTVSLPLACQKLVGQLWDPPADWKDQPDWQPGSWGGHEMLLGGYDGGHFFAKTWDQTQPISVAFYLTYGVDTRAMVSRGWLNGRGVTPRGLNLTAIEADAKQLQGA
jgi:hypothetical protein